MPKQKLYIGNLYYRVTEGDVRELLRDYGPIYSLRLVYSEAVQVRRYGFVELDEPAANMALRELNYTVFFGRTLIIRKTTGSDTLGNRLPRNGYGEPDSGNWPDGDVREHRNFGKYGDFRRKDFKSLNINGKYYQIKRDNYGLYHTYTFTKEEARYSGPSNKSPGTATP